MEMVRLNKIYQDIEDELVRAESHGPIFNSLHEAYAVIAEEVDELWDITRQKQSKRDREEIRKELVQIAAMAVKAIRSIQNFGGRAVEVTPSTQARTEADWVSGDALAQRQFNDW